MIEMLGTPPKASQPETNLFSSIVLPIAFTPIHNRVLSLTVGKSSLALLKALLNSSCDFSLKPIEL